MKIIVFDPGGTTGYAVGVIERYKAPMKVKAGQAKWNHLQIYSQLTIAKPDLIVCESFQYRNRARDKLELISCEYIGVITLFAQENEIKLQFQTPAYGVGGFYTDKKLKEIDYWVKNEPHSMDALRHLLQWYNFGSGFQFNHNGFMKDDGK